MQDLQSKLLELNEAIDMIDESLKAFGEDEELQEQYDNLVTEREELIKVMDNIN